MPKETLLRLAAPDYNFAFKQIPPIQFLLRFEDRLDPARLRSALDVVLADYWRGEYATFWRPPPNYAGTIVDGRAGPAARWLAQQLATALGDTGPVGPRIDDATLRSWIHRFQLAQGLPSDGSAGPITLMQLNRANGVDEPRLQRAT